MQKKYFYIFITFTLIGCNTQKDLLTSYVITRNDFNTIDTVLLASVTHNILDGPFKADLDFFKDTQQVKPFFTISSTDLKIFHGIERSMIGWSKVPQIVSGNYYKGKKSGTWYVYNKTDSVTIMKCFFKNDSLEGERMVFRKNSAGYIDTMEIENYSSGKLNGKVIWNYDENKFEFKYLNDSLHGYAIHWKNGILVGQIVMGKGKIKDILKLNNLKLEKEKENKFSIKLNKEQIAGSLLERIEKYNIFGDGVYTGMIHFCDGELCLQDVKLFENYSQDTVTFKYENEMWKRINQR